MTFERAKAVLLLMGGAVEGFHHGHPDFRVANKIFATLWPDQDRSVLMVGAELSESFAAANGEGYRVVDGGKCLSIQLESIEEAEFQALAEAACKRIAGV